MSRQNVDLLRDCNVLFKRGDLEGLLALHHADVAAAIEDLELVA